jgi:hypothetical protein
MASNFTSAVQELPVARPGGLRVGDINHDVENEEKSWLMVASRGEAAGSNRTFSRKVADAWSAFVDLLKVSVAIESKPLTAYDYNRKLKRSTSLSWDSAT